MIPLQRVPLSAHAQKLLTRWTQKVEDAGATADAARKKWKAADAPKRHVREALESMTRGAVRCMYCDDSRATDIDHFEPLEGAAAATLSPRVSSLTTLTLPTVSTSFRSSATIWAYRLVLTLPTRRRRRWRTSWHDHRTARRVGR